MSNNTSFLQHPQHKGDNKIANLDIRETSFPNNNTINRDMRSQWKHTLIATNCILLSLGYIGGSLLSRLYFLRGGHRRWLSSFLLTASFPILLLPLSFYYMISTNYKSIIFQKTHPLLLSSCAILGIMTGADDFLYAYGLSFLPVSTSVLLLSTHLAFTCFFALLIVGQKFNPFSINAVALLTVGAVILGLHASLDRLVGVSRGEYYLGFGLTVGAAVLYALVLPLIELMYRKGKMGEVSYGLVMEVQFVIGLFASGFCLVGMIVNKDFQAIPMEAMHYELGEIKYYIVLIFNAILWQCFYMGIVGVIFTVNTLLAAIITAVCIPVTEVLGVIFYHENFSSEKGVALALSLWGLASYTYGEYLENKKKMKQDAIISESSNIEAQ